MTKLQQLLSHMGYQSVEDIPFHIIMDSVIDGICMNDDCDYVTGMEPDQTRGYCEHCKTNTVKSLPILAGII